jgi:hypothetical protein
MEEIVGDVVAESVGKAIPEGGAMVAFMGLMVVLRALADTRISILDPAISGENFSSNGSK